MAAGEGGARKAVGHAYPVQAMLGGAVDDFRRRYAGSLQHGRQDVVDVMELLAHLLRLADMIGPCNDQSIARAAQMGSDLLEQGEGGVHGPSPAGRIDLIAVGASKLV